MILGTRLTKELAGPIKASYASPHPTTSQQRGLKFPPQSPCKRSVPQEANPHVTPPDNRRDLLTLDPSEIESIPCPTGLSHMNPQLAMRLNSTEEATAYYNNIRVSALIGSHYSLIRLNHRLSFVDI